MPLTVMLLPDIGPHDLRIMHHRAHDVLDQDDGDAALVELHQQRQDVVDLRMRQAGHGFVGDQELGLRRHGPGELELAHLDLGEIARPSPRLGREPDEPQQLGAARIDFGGGQMHAASRADRVEQRNAQIVGEVHAEERARQLEAARHAEPRALERRISVELDALELDRAGLVAQRPAQAIDQRALAGAVGPDQPDPLAGRNRDSVVFERHETAEPFAEILDFEQRRAHRSLLARSRASMSPMMPFGAIITKPTSTTPTMSRLTADEMVTVATCWTVPSSSAPITGPIHVVVPPTSGMAMLFTA